MASAWRSSMPAAAVGQAENAAAVPRMPWGAPDLQGIWLYQTSTPLERDAAFADKGTSAASWDGPSPSSHHHGTNACKSSRPPVTSPCHDEFGESRLVPVTFREPLPATIRQWAGISRGRWEGDTLVIETTHFNGQRGRWWRPVAGAQPGHRQLRRGHRGTGDLVGDRPLPVAGLQGDRAHLGLGRGRLSTRRTARPNRGGTALPGRRPQLAGRDHSSTGTR